MRKPVLLVVEDDHDLRELIAKSFSRDGYAVTAAPTGSGGLASFQATPPDVVLLDLRLPDLDGLSVCQEMRRLRDVPIIVLTAEASPDIAVRALNLGAADYVRKPVDLAELLARVRAALGTVRPQEYGGVIQGGAIRIDEDNGRVTYQGKDIGASMVEVRVLSFLARHPGTIFSKEQLVKAVWQGERTTHLVEVHTSNIRRKLRSAGCPQEIIKTVPSLGYKFVKP